MNRSPGKYTRQRSLTGKLFHCDFNSFAVERRVVAGRSCRRWPKRNGRKGKNGERKKVPFGRGNEERSEKPSPIRRTKKQRASSFKQAVNEQLISVNMRSLLRA